MRECRLSQSLRARVIVLTAGMASDESVIDWLLAGDSAVRWQVMRDLLDEPAEMWERERRRTLETGCVAELLRHQGPDGEWPKGRWTASTWTLLLLVAYGHPRGPSGCARTARAYPRSLHAARAGRRRCIPAEAGRSLPSRLLARTGCALPGGGSEASSLRRGRPERATRGRRLELCRAQLPEHAHSSFHTTFNVLENLRIAAAEASSRSAPSATLKPGRPSSCSLTACTAPTARAM